MKLSIVLATIRLGSLDVILNSLAQQTDQDFELIVVDEWYEERNAQVKTLHDFDIIHMPPKRYVDYMDDVGAYNTGLAVARGELVAFLNDFIWLDPQFVERHWKLYESTNFKYSMSGFLDHYESPSSIIRDDIKTGWFTAFANEFTKDRADYWFGNHYPIYRERKGGYLGQPILTKQSVYYETPGNKFYAAINDSLPLHILKNLNGLDERYAGGHSGVDIDLGCRAEAIGWKFAVDVDCVNKALDVTGTVSTVDGKIPEKKKVRLRTQAANYQIYEKRMDAIREGESPRTPRGYGAWD